MIKVQALTPSVYYNQSRDFQFIGRLFDVVLNSVKTEADAIYNIPLSDDSDEQLLELLTYTLGLRLRTRRYTTKHLRALCEVYPYALKRKGTTWAVNLICTALVAAEGLISSPNVYIIDRSSTDNTAAPEMVIAVDPSYSYRALLVEAINYVMPAGMRFTILYTIENPVSQATEFGFNGTVTYKANNAPSSKFYTGDSNSKTNILLGDLFDSEGAPISGFSVNTQLYKQEEQE